MDSQSNDEKWMARALELARRAWDYGEVPVGALLVREQQIIGEGWNQSINRHDCSAHAEIVALRDAGLTAGNYRHPGTVLYVTLEPCIMCAGAIVHGRVERLVYGAKEPKAGVVESNLSFFQQRFLNHKVDCVGGVLAQECSDLLSSFFRERRLLSKQV